VAKNLHASNRSHILAGMAYDAMSPFGISWGLLALLLLPVLVAAMGVLVSVRRREMKPRFLLLLTAAAAAGLWTFVTVGAPVMVPIPQDPQGAECLVDAIGENPDRVVPWQSDCGQALTARMVVSAGPTLVMIGTLTAVIAHGARRRKEAVPAL
jgi:hypothetical protein